MSSSKISTLWLHLALAVLRATPHALRWGDLRSALIWLDIQQIATTNRSLALTAPIRSVTGWDLGWLTPFQAAPPPVWGEFIQADAEGCLHPTAAGLALDLDELSRHTESWTKAVAVLLPRDVEFQLRRYGLVLEEAKVPVGEMIPLHVIYRILAFPEAWWRDMEADWWEHVALDEAWARYV